MLRGFIGHFVCPCDFKDPRISRSAEGSSSGEVDGAVAVGWRDPIQQRLRRPKKSKVMLCDAAYCLRARSAPGSWARAQCVLSQHVEMIKRVPFSLRRFRTIVWS